MVKADLIRFLSKQPDFQEEQSTLQKLWSEMGHGCVKGVKCHPEMAGKGIEYVWGKAKYEFRGFINTMSCAAEKLDEAIRRSLGTKPYVDRNGKLRPAPVPLARVWRFCRKCRSYERAYAEYETPASLRRAAKAKNTSSYKVIEKLLAKRKTHRCTGDLQHSVCTREGEIY